MRRLFLATTALLGGAALMPVHAAVVLNPVTYTFSGVCEDCSGTSNATMVLQPTQTGQTEFDNGNASLISFTYQSSFIASTTVAGILSFYANMITVPGANDVSIVTDGFYFTSYGNGNWCVNYGYCGPEISLDYGYSHVWDQTSDVISTPEPVSIALLGTGLMGLLVTRRIRRG